MPSSAGSLEAATDHPGLHQQAQEHAGTAASVAEDLGEVYGPYGSSRPRRRVLEHGAAHSAAHGTPSVPSQGTPAAASGPQAGREREAGTDSAAAAAAATAADATAGSRERRRVARLPYMVVGAAPCVKFDSRPILRYLWREASV